MGKINMSPAMGGGGIKSKHVTATRKEVLKGYRTVTSDSENKVVDGELELMGTMTAADLLPGKTGYSTNPKEPIAGAMPTQGAKTITPGASAQKVAAGRYLTGDITVPGFVMPSADVIKKGAVVEIYGRRVTGNWQGYVASDVDLYYRGNNPAGFRPTNAILDAGQITFKTAETITLIGACNFVGYNYLNVEYADIRTGSGEFNFYLHEVGSSTRIREVRLSDGSGTARLSINTLQISREMGVSFKERDHAYKIKSGIIYRIWLSK